MPKTLIYSVVTNNYDTIKPVKNYEGIDFWLFTDREDLKIDGWKTRVLPKTGNPIKQQRLLKINSFENTIGYDITIYMDGNMELIQDPNLFLERYYKGGLLTCQHPKRSSLREEGREILRKKKDLPQHVERTLQYAKDLGFQDDWGLFETMVLVRDKSSDVRKLEQKWAEILSEYSHRDQLSLPVASFVTGVKVHTIPRAELFRFIKRNRGHNISLKFRGKNDKGILAWLGFR